MSKGVSRTRHVGLKSSPYSDVECNFAKGLHAESGVPAFCVTSEHSYSQHGLKSQILSSVYNPVHYHSSFRYYSYSILSKRWLGIEVGFWLPRSIHTPLIRVHPSKHWAWVCNYEAQDRNDNHAMYGRCQLTKFNSPSSAYTPSSPMNNPSSCIRGPLYPSLNSSIRYTHRIKISTIANDRKPTKILNDAGKANLRSCGAREYLTPNSSASEMKTKSVKTWKQRPAIDTSTAVLLPPEDVEDRAPPMACRIRETMSQGMKIQ